MARRHHVLLPVLVAGTLPAAGTALLGAALLVGSECSPAGAAAPTNAATRAIPADLLAIDQQVGARYGLPWQLLAGIGQEECDQGRNPDPSCTIQPGAQGPGAANSAGASGPMQIGVGGQCGDAYDELRHYLPNPSLGPHDPTTAVELAALVLIRLKGAVPGQPVAAYQTAVAAYNGSGPVAQAYAARVLADANSYTTTSNTTLAAGCDTTSVPLTPGERARILPDGSAAAPMYAPDQVLRAIAAANEIHTYPYPVPDQHYGSLASMWPAYDCSGAVSYVLYKAGLLGPNPEDSTQLEQWGSPGPGGWITVYATSGHAWIVIAGLGFDTADWGGPNIPPGTGPRWRQNPTANLSDGATYVVRHPAGL